MRPVGLITGAPPAGNSSLLSALRESMPNLETVDYGQWLLNTIRQSRPLEYSELRELSSQVVTPALVAETDVAVIEWVRETRNRSPILSDSHAVTKEDYGFRVVPFTHDQLRELALDFIVCLFCTPNETVRRINEDPEGRPGITEQQAFHHAGMQAALANSYGAVTGKPVYHLDSTDSRSEPLTRVKDLLTG